ncbi:serine/threonine-protein kinase RIO3 [Schistocerca americana]|uniref:serine/threonine-protein kinase RIO3 n=1 Tax=Schistocerca americana TaxID=7009 RepID=UPI001F4F96B2|nr:serine/threonine-protein kinase RIO3 [Schistocerca americana]
METAPSKVSCATSPWGKLSQPAETVSFADIMSEQLARDLQLKEEETIYNDTSSQPTSATPELIANSPDCDSDRVIAQMLQVQFDEEYDKMLRRTENKFNGTSKVSVSFSNYRIIPDNLAQDSDSDDYDIDDKHRVWDSFVKSDKAFKEMPKCGYKKQGTEMVTKHDIEMSSRRNASRVMDFPPEFHTGDGGGFDMQLSNKVFNSLKVYSRNEQARRNRLTDKCDQATAELGVDPKTRLLLYKLVNQEILERVNGTLSTGKEAVVLHADGGSNTECVAPKECAVKVFKTTLSEFKTRDKYIQDDFRFKDRFSKQNPRKIIHLWAEKEMHNLIRMQKAGILCPEVVILKKHILVMSFIGENRMPAPKLKEANLKCAELSLAYEDCLSTMKKLYNDAHLVHADLSEYNILWRQGKCWFIDVSQAVERNHPRALEFLFRDCTNISNFFTKKGLSDVASPEEIFKEVCGTAVSEDGPMSMDKAQDFERNEELLTFDQAEKVYSFDYCWEKSKP